MTASIVATGLGVRFQFDRNQRALTPALARLRRHTTESWGLHDVTFTAAPGEAIALIGPSGSGKTTLLPTIGGILAPDAATLDVSGRVGTLLATDAGLTSVLTGRDNAALVGVLLGGTRASARAGLEEVAARIGLGLAFNRPVLSYSEGMRARIGLVAALEAHPDVLLLDEVHEALDHEFREVVERETHALLERGGIVVAAGHDHPLLERISTRALLLDDGRIARDGPFADVQARYLA